MGSKRGRHSARLGGRRSIYYKPWALLLCLSLFTSGVAWAEDLPESESPDVATESEETTGGLETDETTDTEDSSEPASGDDTADSLEDVADSSTTTVPTAPDLDLSTAATLIVNFASGLSADERAAVVSSIGGVETAAIEVLGLHMVAVAPEVVEDALASLSADPSVLSVDQDLSRAAEAVPNDPGYAGQWALPLIGWEDVYGNVDPAGSATIAVLDTGVDALNSDLAGLVAGGWSFDDVDPRTDPSGHGTQVASVAAARVDDGVGTAGVAYSGVSIMPVRVLHDDGTGNDSDIISGLVWAVQNGADIAVMAFSNPGESAALQAAVDYAWSNGVVVVAAAGNDGGTAPTYPAGLAKVVGVGATDSADQVWSGSNRSAAVFMAAPGVGISSSAGTITGTSASAAMVAGAAALMKANDPAASPSVIVGRLARNTDAADASMGNGRLHLGRALVDESTDGVIPAGAPGGGPIVGPYVAANHTLSVACNPGSVTTGGSTSCTGTIGNGSRGQPSSGRTVTFTSNGSGAFTPNDSCTTTGDDSTASCSVTYTPSSVGTGTHRISGTSGSGGHANSDFFDLTVTAPTPAATSTGLASDNNPSTYGDSVTFTAMVTSSPSNPNGVGNVTFKNGAITLCDSVALIGNEATCTTSALSADTHNITAEYSGSATPAPGFAGSASDTLEQVVGQKGLTVDFTAANRVYDGTNEADITGCTLTGVVGSDGVTCSHTSATASFEDENVGNAKTVTGTGFSLAGAASSNYTIATVNTTVANITPKNLTISGAVAQDKVYNGTTTAIVVFTAAILDGVVSDDDVEIDDSGYVADFDTKEIGEDKPVTVTGVDLNGSDAGNYTVSQPADLTADITAFGLTLDGAVAEDKVYDGATSATVDFSDASLVGVFGTDDVAFDVSAYSAEFGDKNVGTGKTVTVTGVVLTGDDAGNYSLMQPAGLSASITPRDVSGRFVAADKVYDGTTAATVLDRSLVGAIGDDDVELDGGTATFADKNAGVGKVVSLTGATLVGDDALNYNLTVVASTTADITPLDISGTFTADDKVYDGTTEATVLTRSLVGAIAGDDVEMDGGTATFEDKNVGDDKTVTATGFFLSGDDAGNYTLASSTLTTTADITPLDITGSFTADDKEYDGTDAATIAFRSLTGAVDGDDVALAGGTATFDDKNVGDDKTVTGTGFSLTGDDAGNYTLASSTLVTTADITPLELTVMGITAEDKVWDGNATATLDVTSAALEGAVVGDDVVLDTSGAVGTFAESSVATWTVSITGLTISGGDADNYALTQPTTTASILAWDAEGHGFYQPVGISNSVFVPAPGDAPTPGDATVWNTAKGGQTVPLKFNVFAGDVKQTDVSAVSHFNMYKLNGCGTGSSVEMSEDLPTTGKTELRYHGAGGQFIQNWATPKAKTDACYRVTVTFADGSSLSAFFKLRK